MTEPIMKITDRASGEVYWINGHNKEEAHEAFGPDIDIQLMWAIPAEEEND